MLFLPIILPPVTPITFGIDIVVGVLGALFGGLFGGGGGGASVQDLTNLRNATATVTDALKRFSWAIAVALGTLLSVMHDLFVFFLDKLKLLVQQVAKILGWVMRSGIPALLKAIRDLRAWLQMIYRNYLRPMLLWIQTARKYLAILRLLHIHIADKLDKWLLSVQSAILAPYLYVMRQVNGIGNWVNLIITIRGIIQRPLFFNTSYAYQADWVNMFYVGQTAAGDFPSPPSGPFPPQPPTPSQVHADLLSYAETGAGQPAVNAQLAVQQAQMALAGG